MENNLLFALDIGTRSVVGIVGEQVNDNIEILAVDRLEHHTRAMLDGQIHDVPEVAAILKKVKQKLEDSCQPLKKVSIAAAGRALCTIKATADLDIISRGALTREDEHTLELAAIQEAQRKLSSTTVDDPTTYYCVGYSVVKFMLDNTQIKTLIGQRGKQASIELIATFLPRQVIDSLQSALKAADLEMETLTLEPIAAINVLIPPTMRHLNLVLVDIGAGTSDIAVTKDGSVIGYGMVPCAGDEITEAISQKYLLDFNVAEDVKRQLTNQDTVTFTDILGLSNTLASNEVVNAIAKNVAELAQAIASQIISLNSNAPQAVLLVGGGSLTPMLPEALAQALDMPPARVAVRRPDSVSGITNISPELCTPDAVTPLGILKLSANDSLNFVNITLNDQTLSLFNLGNLTIADALLAAGIDIRSLQGRPGLGMTISINGQTKFFPGTYGKPGSITLNGKVASFNDQLTENDHIHVVKGIAGTSPTLTVSEVVDIPASFTLSINNTEYTVTPIITVNGKQITSDTTLIDRDQVGCNLPATLEELLLAAGIQTEPHNYTYTINGSERVFSVCPKYYIHNNPANLSSAIKANDDITISKTHEPTFEELLGLNNNSDSVLKVTFNGKECPLPLRCSITVNDNNVQPIDVAPAGSVINFSYNEQSSYIISDVLLAAEFNPKTLTPGKKFDVLLNKLPAEYITPVKNGDIVEIIEIM